MIADLGKKNRITIDPMTKKMAAEFAATSESSIGHEDAANIMSSELGIPVKMNRQNDRLSSGDQILVGQYTGGRLPEGAMTLPEGTSLTWLLVTIE